MTNPSASLTELGAEVVTKNKDFNNHTDAHSQLCNSRNQCQHFDKLKRGISTVACINQYPPALLSEAMVRGGQGIE